MGLLSKLPAALSAIATLRKATRGTKASAGVGVLLTAGLGIGIVTGYVEARHAADLFETAATGIAAAIAFSEYFGKRKAEKGLATADSEVGDLQEILQPIAPIERDKQAPRGGRTQAAAKEAVRLIKDRPELAERVRAQVLRTEPKRRQPKPMNGGRGSK